MRKTNKFLSVALILTIAISAVGITLAYSGNTKMVCEDGANCTFMEAASERIGEMLGGTTNYDSLELSGDLAVTGAISGASTSITGAVDTGIFTQGGGVLELATSTGTTVLTETQLLTDNVLEVMVNTGTTATLTLPATSTLTTLIPNEGDRREWYIHNATSSTMALTIGAGTGMDLIGVTTNDDVIDQTEYSILDCFRQVDTDVTCVISELLHVD